MAGVFRWALGAASTLRWPLQIGHEPSSSSAPITSPPSLRDIIRIAAQSHRTISEHLVSLGLAIPWLTPRAAMCMYSQETGSPPISRIQTHLLCNRSPAFEVRPALFAKAHPSNLPHIIKRKRPAPRDAGRLR